MPGNVSKVWKSGGDGLPGGVATAPFFDTQARSWWFVPIDQSIDDFQPGRGIRELPDIEAVNL